MLTSKRYKCLIVIYLLFASLTAMSFGAQDIKGTDPRFKVYFNSILKEDILKEITASDSKYKLTILDNWPKVSSFNTPHVKYSDADNPKRKISIRLEEDFIVIWYHNSSSFVKGKSNPLDIVKTAFNDIMYPEIENFHIPPKEIPDTNAITVTYGTVSLNKKDSRRWRYIESHFSRKSVLVKDNDAVIVMLLNKARARESYYEGLLAAKTRLSKEEAEKFKDKPVVARNVIFDKKN